MTQDSKLPEGWQIFKFGDLVHNVRETERDPLAAGLERYVGLEHIEPENLHIKEWGLIEEGTSFTQKFVKGQVLFGKRRAYQRKVAVTEFDGVCSGDILVFEPKDDRLLPELLPFIVQSEGFFTNALRTSSGSLSPRTRWRDLATYEFLLPPLDEQRRIAEILWAADEAIVKWENVLQNSEQARSSYRYTFFSGSRGWDRTDLGDLFEVQLGKMLSPKARRGISPRPYLGNANVQWGYFDLTDVKTMDFDDNEFEKFVLRPGDLLVCEGGEVGRSAIWRGEIAGCCYQKALHRLRPINDELRPEILLQFMFFAAHHGLFARFTGHSTIAHLTAVKLKTLRVPVPPLEEQRKAIVAFEQFEKSFQVAEEHLEASRSLKSSLLENTLKPSCQDAK
jgi:type I restriction enzyme S subunit